MDTHLLDLVNLNSLLMGSGLALRWMCVPANGSDDKVRIDFA